MKCADDFHDIKIDIDENALEEIIPPINSDTGYWNILEECAEVAKERGDSYGAVADNFMHTAVVHKVLWNIDMSCQDMAKFLVSLKLARNFNKEKKDNIVDGINYMAILQYLKDENIL